LERENVVVIEELEASLWLVRLLGELDISNISEFRTAIEELRTRPASIIVDMSQTEFIDSSTLHILAQTHEQHTGALAVIIPEQSVVNRVFTASGFDKKLPIYRSSEDALAAIRARRSTSQP
jgi:anti-anti-sigma factor